MADARQTLTTDQKEALEDARKRALRFLGAAKVATFNGWTIGVFAALTIPFGLASATALVLGLGMAVVAHNEFKGRSMVRRIDPAGARLLGWNQVGFMGLIVAYCLWSIFRTYAHPDPQLQQELALVGVAPETVRSLTVAVYAGVIAASLIFQGLNARYYFARVERVEEYLRTTPGWVVELQRTATLD
ncbi:MAG: hypothetical protein LJF04_10790 [Gemmatimonadetes bacterium]|nr:hypothetical protein [Gemmatimonadota bacterium]